MLIRVIVSISTCAAVLLAPLSACNDDCNPAVGPFPRCEPQCPETFQQGAACAYESQQCVFSRGACRDIDTKRTTCTCANRAGGFVWDCVIKQCSCTCPCGVSIIKSCDAVDCADREDECPASVAIDCEFQCAGPDAGSTPDAGAADAPVGDSTSPARDSVVDAPPVDSTQHDSTSVDSAAADALASDVANE